MECYYNCSIDQDKTSEMGVNVNGNYQAGSRDYSYLLPADQCVDKLYCILLRNVAIDFVFSKLLPWYCLSSSLAVIHHADGTLYSTDRRVIVVLY